MLPFTRWLELAGFTTTVTAGFAGGFGGPAWNPPQPLMKRSPNKKGIIAKGGLTTGPIAFLVISPILVSGRRCCDWRQSSELCLSGTGAESPILKLISCLVPKREWPRPEPVSASAAVPGSWWRNLYSGNLKPLGGSARGVGN